MTHAFVLLFVVLVGLRIALQLRPRRDDEGLRLEAHILADAERSLRAGMSPLRRVRLKILSHYFLSQGERRRVAAVQRLRDESRLFPLPVVKARRFSRGVRDICAFELPDGRQLELAIYDGKNADAMVGAWRREPASSIRLSWHGQLGWCCTLHQPDDSYAPPHARALAWEATVTTV